MRYLTLEEVLELYHRIIEQSGGTEGISNLGGLESALAQPRMTFGGEELYPTIVEKAMASQMLIDHPNSTKQHSYLTILLVSSPLIPNLLLILQRFYS